MFSFACVRVMCCDEHEVRASTQLESKGEMCSFCCLLCMGCSPGSKERVFAKPCNSFSTRLNLIYCGRDGHKGHPAWPNPEELPQQSWGCSSSSPASGAQQLISASSAPNPGTSA